MDQEPRLRAAALKRLLWLAAGLASLAAGIVGIFLPLMPTVPFVLLAAFCFSRGSKRLELWLLTHRHFGPMVEDWRRDRSVPLRAKQAATVMMACSSVAALWVGAPPWNWLPALVSGFVIAWLWRLPTSTLANTRPDDRPSP